MFFPTIAAVDTIKESKNTCVVFIRVSSKKQEDGVSLDAQLSLIKEWTKSNGITILKVFSMIGSGRNVDESKIFNQMINFVKRNKPGYVSVYSVDRFSRNAIDASYYMKQILRLKIKFVSVVDSLCISNNNSQESQRFMQLIQAAEIESNKISERVRGANKYLREKGWMFGRCPKNMKVVFVLVERNEEGLEPIRIRTFVPNDTEPEGAGMPDIYVDDSTTIAYSNADSASTTDDLNEELEKLYVF